MLHSDIDQHSNEWGDPFTFRPGRFLDGSGLLLSASHPRRQRLLTFFFYRRVSYLKKYRKRQLKYRIIYSFISHFLKFRLLIFGFGKRSCIGEVFAKNRMFLFFATLMQICTVTKPSAETLNHLDPREMLPGLVLQPRPYKVQFKLRDASLSAERWMKGRYNLTGWHSPANHPHLSFVYWMVYIYSETNILYMYK